MRIFLPTTDLMIMLFDLLTKYNPTNDINSHRIKFIHNNIKCCLTFTSHHCELLHIDFIKHICFYIGSTRKFVWMYNSAHPYLSKQESYDYVANYIVTNITYYVMNNKR